MSISFAPSSLSFGIEFEFYLAYLPTGKPDPEPQNTREARLGRLIDQSTTASPDADLPTFHHRSTDHERRVRQNIVNRLREAGLPARIDSYEDMYPAPLARKANVQRVDASVRELKWNVGYDGSIAPPRSEVYQYYKVEISSPALTFCAESLESVRTMLDVLNSTYRIGVNASCGLHVHVGNGSANESRGFTLAEKQELFAFLYVVEPILDQCHSGRRVGGEFCKPIRTSTVLGAQMVDERRSLMDGVMAIFRTTNKNRWDYSAKSLHALCEESEDNFYRLAYDLSTLGDAQGEACAVKRTVEFRQHEGTLDPERAVMWIKTAVGIIAFAKGMGRQRMLALLRDFISKEQVGERVSLRELFVLMRLNESAVSYCK